MTGDLQTDKVGPVDHILRAPLPWRTAADLTECGKAASDLAGRLVTRDEAAARITRIGKVRAAFTLCITCAETSDRRNRWDPVDAVAVVARETNAVQHATPPLPPSPYDGPRSAERQRRTRDQWAARQMLNAEFEAIKALIGAHRDEYDGYLAGKAAAVSLDDMRRRRRRRPSP